MSCVLELTNGVVCGGELPWECCGVFDHEPNIADFPVSPSTQLLVSRVPSSLLFCFGFRLSFKGGILKAINEEKREKMQILFRDSD